jgi:hypothetical protein
VRETAPTERAAAVSVVTTVVIKRETALLTREAPVVRRETPVVTREVPVIALVSAWKYSETALVRLTPPRRTMSTQRK